MREFARDELFEAMKQFYLETGTEADLLIYPVEARIAGIEAPSRIAGVPAVGIPEVTKLHFVRSGWGAPACKEAS